MKKTKTKTRCGLVAAMHWLTPTLLIAGFLSACSHRTVTQAQTDSHLSGFALPILGMGLCAFSPLLPKQLRLPGMALIALLNAVATFLFFKFGLRFDFNAAAAIVGTVCCLVDGVQRYLPRKAAKALFEDVLQPLMPSVPAARVNWNVVPMSDGDSTEVA